MVKIIVVLGLMFLLLCALVYSIVKEFCRRRHIKRCIKNIKVGDKFSYAWCSDWNNPFATIFVDFVEVIDVKYNHNNEKWIKYTTETISEDGIILTKKDEPTVHTDSAEEFFEIYYSDPTNKITNF